MTTTRLGTAADQDETVDDLLRTSARRSRSVPIRRSFVQQGQQNKPIPGPLSSMLRAHDGRALDLYLLHHAVASAQPWDVTRDSRMWARCLGMPSDSVSGAAVSKVWRRLESTYKLVQRERSGRLTKIIALKDDGSGEPYSYPSDSRSAEPYFKIPFEYWSSESRHYRHLSFGAKAMLLVALTLPASFSLPTVRVPDWYGISADTADRGLRELDRVGLLQRRMTVTKAPQAPLGIKKEYRHTLVAPYVHRQPRRQPSRILIAP